MQLTRLESFIAARKRNFARLYAGLKPLEEFLILPKALPKADAAWFGFPITVRSSASRIELVKALEEAKIETRQIFAGNITRQPLFKDVPHRIFGDLRESDRVMMDAFFIGVYPGLTEEMVDFMVKQVTECLTGSAVRR